MKFFMILVISLLLSSCSSSNKEDAEKYRVIAFNDLAMCDNLVMHSDSILVNKTLVAEAKKSYLHGLTNEKHENNKFMLFREYQQCIEDYQTCSNLIALACGRQPLYP